MREAVLALLVLSAYLLPWGAYQKFVDPPGNRLLKMHLAGRIPVDSRSTWEGITDAYRGHTLQEIARFKWSNVTLLFGHKPLDSFGVGSVDVHEGVHLDHASTGRSRIAQREWVWNAIGVLNFGWIAGFLLLLTRRHYSFAIPFSPWLMTAASVNLLVWALVTFGPDETVTTHSSYADILLLNLGLAGIVLTLPRFVHLSLLALQIFNFWVVWVWSSPRRLGVSSMHVVLQSPLLILGALFTLATLLYSAAQPIYSRSR